MKNIRFHTFSSLFEKAVDPVINYGAGIWGYIKTPHIDRIQYRAGRYFLGVHSRTPIPAIEGEMGWIPSKYKRQIKMFMLWNRICRMPDSRICKVALLNDIAMCKSNWCNAFRSICEQLDVVSSFNELSIIDITSIKNKLWEIAEKDWKERVKSKPKLRTYVLFKESFVTEQYVQRPLNRYRRSILAQFRCGILPLNLEMGRFRGLQENERICEMCSNNMIESEMHFLLECDAYIDIRNNMLQQINDRDNLSNDYIVVILMQNFHKAVLSYLQEAWTRRQSKLFNN